MITLKNYCKEKNTTLEEFAKLCEVSRAQIYLIANNSKHNITAQTARKIYNKTLQKYGEGLDIWQYIELKT